MPMIGDCSRSGNYLFLKRKHFFEERIQSCSLSSRARRGVFADLEMMAARMEKAISEEVGVETHILILTSNRLSDLRETDTPFYLSLLRTGYTLKGESIEEY